MLRCHGGDISIPTSCYPYAYCIRITHIHTNSVRGRLARHSCIFHRTRSGLFACIIDSRINISTVSDPEIISFLKPPGIRKFVEKMSTNSHCATGILQAYNILIDGVPKVNYFYGHTVSHSIEIGGRFPFYQLLNRCLISWYGPWKPRHLCSSRSS